MSIATDRFTLARIRCHWRPVIMVGAGLVLLSIFWFASRYPQLFSKAKHVGEALPSMAYSSQLMIVAADAPVGLRILAATVNWLDSMKIGMTFGVLFGALLHTVLRYYPLKIGKNLYLNSLKGALVGVPMGVCANCAVPAACGVTRGNGRLGVLIQFAEFQSSRGYDDLHGTPACDGSDEVRRPVICHFVWRAIVDPLVGTRKASARFHGR